MRFLRPQWLFTWEVKHGIAPRGRVPVGFHCEPKTLLRRVYHFFAHTLLHLSDCIG